MDLPLNILPIEAAVRFIQSAPTFEFVVSLYNLNPEVKELLDGRPGQRQPQLDIFVDLSVPEYTPYQTQILSELNQRFQLGVLPPLSFAKLIKAYKRSGLNLTCKDYASTLECMYSTAKQGNVSTFKSLYFQWEQEQKQVELLIPRGRPIDVSFTYVQNSRVLCKALEHIHNHGHLAAGRELWDFFRSEVDPGEIEERDIIPVWIAITKAWLKEILRSHKVLSTRDIRNNNYLKLYDVNVSDAEKRDIWRQKYGLSTLVMLPLAESIPEGMYTMIGNSLRLKLGLVDDQGELDELLHDSDLNDVYQVFAAYTGVNVPDPREESTPILFKRGYFQALQNTSLVNGGYDWTSEWIGDRSLVSLLGNLTPDQLSLLVENFSKVIDEQYSPEKVLKVIILGNLTHLYDDYLVRYQTLDLRTIFLSLFASISDIKSIPILNRIFRHLVQIRDQWVNNKDYIRWLRSWFEDNSAFLFDIWREFGRRQFEDSLIYLADNFGLVFKISDEVIRDIIAAKSWGMLAYIVGYKLLPGGGFQPMADLGIISTNKDLFQQRFLVMLAALTRDGYYDIGLLLYKLEGTINRTEHPRGYSS